MAHPLHPDEIRVDVELVRALVGRAMPDYADAPVRRLASSGSTNSLFRLGDEFLVRLPRQPGGSATISKEATWLPVLGQRLPVSVPDVVAVFEPDRDYPERWSVVRWIEGEHPGVVDPEASVDPRREDLAKDLAAVLEALRQAEVPTGAVNDPSLRWYRGLRGDLLPPRRPAQPVEQPQPQVTHGLSHAIKVSVVLVLACRRTRHAARGSTSVYGWPSYG